MVEINESASILSSGFSYCPKAGSANSSLCPASPPPPTSAKPSHLHPQRHFPVLEDGDCNRDFDINFNEFIQVPLEFILGPTPPQDTADASFSAHELRKGHMTMLVEGTLGWTSNDVGSVLKFSGYLVRQYPPGYSPTPTTTQECRPVYELPLPYYRHAPHELPDSQPSPFHPPLQTSYVGAEPEWLDLRALHLVHIGRHPAGYIRKFDVAALEDEEMDRLAKFRKETVLGLAPVPSLTSDEKRWMIAPTGYWSGPARTPNTADEVENERKLDMMFEYARVDDATRRRRLEERVAGWGREVFAEDGEGIDSEEVPELDEWLGEEERGREKEYACMAMFWQERGPVFGYLDWVAGIMKSVDAVVQVMGVYCRFSD
ncbi:hypothetical protein BJ508DRAFT_334508 [Ascobolus immersus RN42]|uniref:Uncharacterized protein n=1 Tax=Ascobolus immersus RN42 TaxID=1160509 RepID=A0A3N4HFU3_ASCIM|nr:hypothetical protein BJ508DRAFT_334508 [Ascobolus immersus RN42]